MKLIKIITCHKVYNAGASLQAYALQSYIEKKGYDVKIIDYQPDYLRHVKLAFVANPKYDKLFLKWIYIILKMPEWIKFRLGKKRRYDMFSQRFLKCTEHIYYTFIELKENPPLADVYIAGSDQIWNPLFKNGRDPAFYLEFVPDTAVRASYAASIAMDNIPDKYKKMMKARLEKFQYISVREKTGVRLLSNLSVGQVYNVLDPVFFIEQNKWAEMAEKINTREPYVLIYTFEKKDGMIQEVRKLYKDRGWKIYSVLKVKGADKTFENSGPLTFLGLIKNAQIVISNSFHATAFSIIFHKEFITYGRKENINTRMSDLLGICGLENRMISKMDDIKQVASEKIDYKKVSGIIETEKTKSNNFLEKVLKDK